MDCRPGCIHYGATSKETGESFGGELINIGRSFPKEWFGCPARSSGFMLLFEKSVSVQCCTSVR